MSAVRGECSVSEIPRYFEQYYDSLYSSKPCCLDAFSITQRLLGKHEARNFEVLRADDDSLYLHGTEGTVDIENLQIMADECKLMYDATNEYGGYFLYVQCPYKNVGQAPELAYYSDDITEESETFLDDLIREKGIPVLDLRDYPETMEYYNTDHHWTTQSAFNASNIIVNEFEKEYGLNLVEHDYYGNMDNYEPITYEDCFLGSIGVKVGTYFAGKDDFTIYNPMFSTDLLFEHYVDNELDFSYSGDFWTTFIADEKLADPNYNNKYNVNMHGAWEESIICNNLSYNNYKGLLITHSYGRPMAQYMCFDFSEFRYVDPQIGRFNENLVEYIREYQPDVVVYMYNGKVNVGDENGNQ